MTKVRAENDPCTVIICLGRVQGAAVPGIESHLYALTMMGFVNGMLLSVYGAHHLFNPLFNFVPIFRFNGEHREYLLSVFYIVINFTYLRIFFRMY